MPIESLRFIAKHCKALRVVANGCQDFKRVVPKAGDA